MSPDVQELAARLRDFSRGRDDVHSRAAILLENLDKEVSHWWRLSQRRQEESKTLRQEVVRYRSLLGVKNTPDADTQELIALHNATRAKASWAWTLPPLKFNQKLTEYAQEHALWMSNVNRLKHSRLKDMLQAGFSAVAENIAWGQTTPASVLNSWLWSPGHRRNIMSTSYNSIGCGARKDSRGRLYWCVCFGYARPQEPKQDVSISP